MKTIDFSYFIERYNAGEMSEAEKEWFQKELDGNENLRNEVKIRRKTDEVLKDQNILSLRSKLASIESRRREAEIPKNVPGHRGYIKYAALVAGLVLIGSLVLFSGRNISGDEIMNRYYSSYKAQASSRSGLSETNADFTLALELYNAKDYGKAALYFNKVVESNPKDMQSTLLNGISNFENNQYPEAKKSFRNVIEDNNNLYIDQAQWYLALCYIRTDEKDKAIRQLEMIKKESGIYRNDAKKILRKLK
jgi:tetratricopeptide (TPR) repeat protein